MNGDFWRSVSEVFERLSNGNIGGGREGACLLIDDTEWEVLPIPGKRN